MMELTEEGFMKSKSPSLDRADAIATEIRTKEDALTGALAKIASSNAEARKILAVPGHIEEAANRITRLSIESRSRIKEGMLFSDKAIVETSKLFTKAKEILKKAADASVTGSSAAVGAIETECVALERMASDFATSHEERLVAGECSPKSASTYLSMLNAFGGMGGQIKNVVKKLSAV